jgi:hypothetical protein
MNYENPGLLKSYCIEGGVSITSVFYSIISIANTGDCYIIVLETKLRHKNLGDDVSTNESEGIFKF